MQINIVEALEVQKEQLKRLLVSPVWISDAPKATLDEMATQIANIKSLIQELEELIEKQRTNAG